MIYSSTIEGVAIGQSEKATPASHPFTPEDRGKGESPLGAHAGSVMAKQVFWHRGLGQLTSKQHYAFQRLKWWMVASGFVGFGVGIGMGYAMWGMG